MAAADSQGGTRWGTHTLFFYGTLVHPAILERVIGNPGAHLRVQNAILPAYATWHVQGVDYPALVALSDRAPQASITALPEAAITASPGDASPAPAAVPGTLVSGLTDADLRYLDLFEGDEYVRKAVDVLPLNSGDSDSGTGISNALRPRDASLADILADLSPARCAHILNALSTSTSSVQTVKAEAYVWCAPLSMLEDRRWVFAEFAREKARRWVGAQADHEYTDVDRERGA
ncbi:hypothetical protein OC842_002010 [Tilletia horrida]|uniref:Putative gamma-glutamylcyclotransferase n=1 Tax=Tilletia horrida TaxID=155126 RepID=A0AAN6JM02_9BASI|nr:hypothetical protein OC842_002010 [Tilletia horrida]KAK0563907.1 hypothetical protein OC844_001956 [Tilletia horrida]